MLESPPFEARTARGTLSVFFLSGLLMSLPGAILPAWGYHIRDDFLAIGAFFLATGAGLLISALTAGRALERWRVHGVLAAGAGSGALAFLSLALTGPPVQWPWRLVGFLLLGLAAGLLNMAAFQSLGSVYERDPAAAVNLAGVLFGLGCLATALFVATTFYVYTVGSALVLAALIPGFAAALYMRRPFATRIAHADRTWREVWEDIKSPAAVLFSLLLFFQFGNEWTVAGWLALFLVRRVGISPDTSLMMLAAYWMALLVGRVVAQGLLPRVGHTKLLFGSAMSAMFGCVVLMVTDNAFGAWMGVLPVGLGFAAIYPLVVERIGGRFPDYHPGFFNGLYSCGVSGGLLAPFLVAIPAHYFGVWVVMALPLLGTVAVAALTVTLWVEARLNG